VMKAVDTLVAPTAAVANPVPLRAREDRSRKVCDAYRTWEPLLTTDPPKCAGHDSAQIGKR
jgi:hypothetical protein